VLSFTGGRKAALAAALAVLATAVPAAARPDDVPTEVRKPAAGATIADATAGIAVDFTCPVYHRYPQDELITAPSEGYHVVLSTKADVDDSGLLVADGRVDVRDARVLDDVPGHCTAVEDDAGNGLLPREPGTYHLQAYRECEPYVCRGGVEASDVVTISVRRTVCTVNRGALTVTRRALREARTALGRHRTAARRARVTRLQARVTMLRSRLTVVYGCRP
jgi:hypothetical protein